MVKFWTSDYTYDYGFSTVSLAYFLRYPNPYARHVASTDTIERHFDPETQRLTTVRLHLKRSRMPPAVVKLLPSSYMSNATPDGRTQSFILEKSVVDVREGWMESESRNLDWNNVLSVIEKHRYERPAGGGEETTAVRISVTLKSRIGEQIRRRRARWRWCRRCAMCGECITRVITMDGHAGGRLRSCPRLASACNPPTTLRRTTARSGRWSGQATRCT